MSPVKFPILCISFSLLCNFKDCSEMKCMGWAEGVHLVTKSNAHGIQAVT